MCCTNLVGIYVSSRCGLSRLSRTIEHLDDMKQRFPIAAVFVLSSYHELLIKKKSMGLWEISFFLCKEIFAVLNFL